MKMDFDLRDLNRSALERIVKQLLVSDEEQEKKILDQLTADAEKESNDLADLTEEKRGKPAEIAMDDEPKKKGA
jgi:predicted lactoylglutathione lyase